MTALLSSSHLCFLASQVFEVLQGCPWLDNLKYHEVYHSLCLGATYKGYDLVLYFATKQTFSR